MPDCGDFSLTRANRPCDSPQQGRRLMTSVVRRSALLAALLVGSVSASATDRPIGAKRLVLRRSAAGAESLILVSSDPAFLFPPIGGADDPATGTPGGGRLELLPLGGAIAAFDMPAGAGGSGWTATHATTDRYRFTNAGAPNAFSAVKTAVLRSGRTLRIVGRSVGISLPVATGRLGVRFTTGSLRSCAVFDEPSIAVDDPDRFVARNASAPAAASCSSGSLGLSTCGNGTREFDEQCDGADATACLGSCAADCTCVPACGDGVVNQPAEECDPPEGTGMCPAGYFGCTATCECCSADGLFCNIYGCCDPNDACLPGPDGMGLCLQTTCTPPDTCDPSLTCESGFCCQGTPGGFCLYLGIGPLCCDGLTCNFDGTLGYCCIDAGGACANDADCCSGACNDGSSTCDP